MESSSSYICEEMSARYRSTIYVKLFPDNQSRSRQTTRNYTDITLFRIRLKIAKRSFFLYGGDRGSTHLRISVGQCGHIIQNFRRMIFCKLYLMFVC